MVDGVRHRLVDADRPPNVLQMPAGLCLPHAWLCLVAQRLGRRHVGCPGRAAFLRSCACC
eukprot:5490219-Alexandrium_andersonii.AAC.1